MSLDIKNLVFEGGGVLGIAYAGALAVLQNAKLLDNIDKVAGTSAGAITATLVSLRYSPDEIRKIVEETNFKDFEDRKNPLRIPFSYGLYKGNAFLEWMQDKIEAKGFDKTATFADFNKKGCRELRVFATDLNTKSLRTFSFAKTPNVVVAEAVRASMSIPMFFQAWQFSNQNPDNHIYVDGGTIYNFPITTFDENGFNYQTLGFHLDNLSEKPVIDDLKYDELIHYIKNIFETLLQTQVIDFRTDPMNMKRSVCIDNLAIKATDFDITKDEIDRLYKSGFDYTTEYLKNNL